MELLSPALQADSLPAELPGKPNEKQMTSFLNKKSAEYFATMNIKLVDSYLWKITFIEKTVLDLIQPSSDMCVMR